MTQSLKKVNNSSWTLIATNPAYIYFKQEGMMAFVSAPTDDSVAIDMAAKEKHTTGTATNVYAKAYKGQEISIVVVE